MSISPAPGAQPQPVPPRPPAPALPPPVQAVVTDMTDVLSRVLTPSLQTWEGKIAVSLTGVIQALEAGFGVLTWLGALHPTATLSAEVVGGGQVIAAWLATTFLKNRSAVKAAAASSISSSSG
jgi:hypothetical protein